MNLYELSSELAAALRQDDDGELYFDLERSLDALSGDFTEKAQQVMRARANYLSDVAAISAEEKRLAAIRQRLESRAEWLKDYLYRCMKAIDMPRVEGVLFTATIRKNPPSVVVEVPTTFLPDEFVRIVPAKREPDKKALLAAFKAGTMPDGVRVEYGERLEIK